MVKIDPYLNVDAGTMRPTEHGEVFVTYDGGETDQDLGTYERFIGKEFSRTNNLTSGQVYLKVIQRERNLEYDGKCVELLYHVPEEIRNRIQQIIDAKRPDFLIVEVGGTVGDYQNVLFLDAFRVLKLQQNHVTFVHVVYLPVPHNLGEMKTKPAQHSVRLLNEHGIQPDFVVTRSSVPMDGVRKEKLALFGNIKQDHIIASPDTDNVYAVPLLLEAEGLTEKLLSQAGMPYRKGTLAAHERKITEIRSIKKTVKVAIIGKYFDIGAFALSDSYLSVIEALRHASWEAGVKPELSWLDSKSYEKDPAKLSEISGYDGIVIPGGFGNSGVEGKIAAIRYAREHKIPFLGLCYGLQLAVVEFARDVCGMKDASSTEFDPKTKHPVIDILPEQVEKLKKKDYGNTMRLGNYPAVLVKGTKVHGCYGTDKVVERHRHRYEVNPAFIEELSAKGLVFSGRSPDRKLMEFVELPDHPFFVGTQAHPEFRSQFDRPSPLFLGFIRACMKNRQ